jgi:hypothetical protein
MFIIYELIKCKSMKAVSSMRTCILLAILLSIMSCVSDSSTSDTTEPSTSEVSSAAENTNVAQQITTQGQETVIGQAKPKIEIPTKKPAAKKPKAKSNPINPQAKKMVIDQAKQELSELEANKGSMSASDYSRKKESYETMIANPEKFIPKPNSTPRQANTLPNSCELISESFIAKTIGVSEEAISMKDGTNAASEHARACFFRWDHKGVANSGVLIQIQENPLPDEIDDWAAYYIQAKINQGETNPNTMESTRFKVYKDLGVSGAYNYEMQRYLWRTEDGIVFMIAFNLRASEKEQLSWAKTLGEEIMKNYRP